MSKVVTDNLTPEDIREADQKEMDVETILRLVDLIFLGYDDSRTIPS